MPRATRNPRRTNERVRLRLVNVANARVMPVRIAGHGATVMAIDGQPAEPFALDRARVVLSPGTRSMSSSMPRCAAGQLATIMVDIGEEVAVARLVYEPGERSARRRFPERERCRPIPFPSAWTSETPSP